MEKGRARGLDAKVDGHAFVRGRVVEGCLHEGEECRTVFRRESGFEVVFGLAVGCQAAVDA